MNFFSIFKRNLIYKFKKKIDIDSDTFEKDIGLEKLFSFYETDKAEFIGKGNIEGHGFSDFYETHFSKIKEKKLKILEIGSYSGASAAAFANYFQNSTIYCLDVNLSKFIYKSKKIFPFGIDVTNIHMIEKFLNTIEFKKSISFFDIIIDDGSHILSHQLKAINYFLKLVKKGGYYIVEDYKFPEYFQHLKDVQHLPLSQIIKNVRKNNIVKSDFIETYTYELLKKERSNIFQYKGKKDFSDIMFIEKLT